MNPTRVAVAGLLSAIVTLCLLLLMNLLINNQFDLPDESSAVRVAAIHMPNISIEARIEDVKPIKPELQETPPLEIPSPAFDAPQLSPDSFAINGSLTTDRAPVRPGALAVNEGEYLPIVKVPAEYPSAALSRGIEGYCTVVYTVTETGTTRDVQPVAGECVTKDGQSTTVFDRASVRAASKFKYKPKVVDGKPIEVNGVKNRFIYEMKH
ncbi:MAG TPA: TonB family protein [Cellvibrio sp.]|nr:TonB family protein [Cellvibrio sp.]